MMGGNFWGDLLRELRIERHLTLRSLSAQTGVIRATIRRIEIGATSPELRVIEQLLNHLGYDLEAMESEGLEERMRVAAERECDPVKRGRIAVIRLLLLGTNLTMPA